MTQALRKRCRGGAGRLWRGAAAVLLAGAAIAGGVLGAGAQGQGRPAATPAFAEDFTRFDAGEDQQRPTPPHRWRTVYGYGGPLGFDNRKMSGTSVAVDRDFTGVQAGAPGPVPLGLDPFRWHRRPEGGGELTILADRTPDRLRPLLWDKPYYSGVITTRFSFAQRFGYFEVEARLPVGKGLWPAFWLLPVKGGWPAGGEIDVFEGLGEAHTIYCTVIGGQGVTHQAKVALPFDVGGGFHRYGVLWGAQEIRWFVDRRQVASAPTPPALRDGEMYMLANLAVGGAWGGQPDGHTAFPAAYVLRGVQAWSLGRGPVE